jgi:sugar lactone lactonase YvrE
MTARAALGMDKAERGAAEPWSETRAHIAESPVWDDRHGELVWVDLEVGRVHWENPAAADRASIDCGRSVGAVVPRQSGGWVLMLADGIAVLDSRDAAPRIMADIPASGVRFNDAKCDPVGRLWAGTMAPDISPQAGALHRVDADWSVTTVLTGLTLPNGIAWTRSGTTMYVVESRERAVWAYEYDLSSGELGARRDFVLLSMDDGEPDGITVDDDGGLWVAIYGSGEVRRYLPSGELDRVVKVPASRVTSCAFGDNGFSSLYITTAAHPDDQRGGQVFRIVPAVRGRRADRFAG